MTGQLGDLQKRLNRSRLAAVYAKQEAANAKDVNVRRSYELNCWQKAGPVQLTICSEASTATRETTELRQIFSTIVYSLLSLNFAR